MIGFGIFAACVLWSSLIIFLLRLRQENRGTSIYTTRLPLTRLDTTRRERQRVKSLFSGTHLSPEVKKAHAEMRVKSLGLGEKNGSN